MNEAMTQALKNYQQADTDGIMVLVSRQACDEAAELIPALHSQLAEKDAALQAAIQRAEEAERERDDAADAAEEAEAACHALQARMGKLEEAAKGAVSLLALRAVRFSDGVPVGPIGNAHDLLAAALAIREGGEVQGK